MNKKIILSLLLAVLVLVTISAVAAADININGTSFDDVQKAIDSANPGDTIYLNNGTYQANDTNPEPITINTNDLTIYGGKTAYDNKYSTLDGLRISQIMSINATNIKIVGINFINGYSDEYGALYLNHGSSLTIENSLFKYNGYDESDYYAEYGGAIVALNSDLTIINSVFTNNNAFHKGGAIYGENINLNIDTCEFKSNECHDSECYGGAISTYGNLTLTDSKFISNDAYLGGAIYYLPSSIRDKYEGSLFVDGCTFTGNSANYGGAIYAPYGALTITDSEFMQNTGNGAAIYNSLEYIGDSETFINNVLSSENYLNIDNSIFINNQNSRLPIKSIQQPAYGDLLKQTKVGAVFGMYGAIVTSFSLNVDSSKFTANSGNGFGGAITITDIFNDKSSKDPISSLFTSVPVINAVISNSEFNSNSAATGGAIAFVNRNSENPIPADKLTIYNSKFDGNVIASGNSGLLVGGAVFSMVTTVVEESTFTNNLINSTETGPLKSTFSNLGGSNAFVSSNIYDGSGGAIGVMGNLNITNSYFEGNRALKGGAVAVLGTLFMDDCLFVSNNASFITVKSKLDEAKEALDNATSAYEKAKAVSSGDSKINDAENLLNNANIAYLQAQKCYVAGDSTYIKYCDDCIKLSSDCIEICREIIDVPKELLEAGQSLDTAESKFDEAKTVGAPDEELYPAQECLNKANDAYNKANECYKNKDSSYPIYCKESLTLSQECIKRCDDIISKYSRVYKAENDYSTKEIEGEIIPIPIRPVEPVNSNTFGGAVFVIGFANINDCSFVDNYAYSAGAISILGSLNITDCDFINNTAQTTGGAISTLSLNLVGSSFNIKSQINVVDCDFIGNAAIGTENTSPKGGAISIIDSSLTASDSSLNLIDSYFKDNSAYTGGAIYYSPIRFSKLYVDNCEFVENTASYAGGAISLHVMDISSDYSLNITDSIFYGNKAKYGGAIESNPSYPITSSDDAGMTNAMEIKPVSYVCGYVTDCVFVENTASREGGAIAGTGLIVNYNIFEGNDAVLGSAIYDVSIIRSSKQIISNYDYNFWGFANDVTKFPKNLIFNPESSVAPANWVVVDIIEPVEGGNVFGVNFVLNDGSELTGVMPDYNALLTVNNMIKSINIVKNEYTDAVDSTGKYNVAVYCPLDGDLLASTSFNVETLEMVVTTTVNGTTATITVKVAKDATGKVGFHIDQLLGIKYVDVVDGVAVCKYDKLAAGEHSVDVSYLGDDYVYQVSKATFTVSDIKMTADDVDKFYKGSQQYIVTLVDGTPLAGETIAITINGNTYTRVTDENGQAKMNINLNPGIYTVTATYNGETITNTVVVKSTVIGKDLTKMYCNDSQYYATFLDSEGKVLVNTAVWFNINGVIYNRVTDEHGIAGLNINLIPDEYIITAYNSATGQLFSNIVKVLPPLVQVKTVDNLVALQVLDKTGQPVKAGEDVLLNFKGKLLSATSDANGMVFFTDPSFDGTFATAYYDGCLVNVNLSSAKINTDEKEAIPW